MKKESVLIEDLLRNEGHVLLPGVTDAPITTRNASKSVGRVPYSIPVTFADHRHLVDDSSDVPLQAEFEALLRKIDEATTGGCQRLEASISNLFRMVTHELKRPPFANTPISNLFDPLQSAQAQLQIMNDFENWINQPSDNSDPEKIVLFELISVHARSFLQATREQATLELTFNECPMDSLLALSGTLLTFLRRSLEPLSMLVVANESGPVFGNNSSAIVMATLHNLLASGSNVSTQFESWWESCTQRIAARKVQLVARKGYILRQMLSLLRSVRASAHHNLRQISRDPLNRQLSLQARRWQTEKLLSITLMGEIDVPPASQLRPLSPLSPPEQPPTPESLESDSDPLANMSLGVRQRTVARLRAVPRAAFQKLPPLKM